MLKTIKRGDTAAALGANCVQVDPKEVAKKNVYAPKSARLIEGDIVELNVVDESGKLIWGKDSRLNDSYFILATLTRGKRTLENYHLYPTMLLRSSVSKIGASHSADMKNPTWIVNSGLPELLPSQDLVSYMTDLIHAIIKVAKITPEQVWGLDFDKISKAGKKVSDLPKPIIDEWWIEVTQKFYDFTLFLANEDADAEAAINASVIGG